MSDRRILQRGDAIRWRDLLQDEALPFPAEFQLRDALEISPPRQTAAVPAVAHAQRSNDGGLRQPARHPRYLGRDADHYAT